MSSVNLEALDKVSRLLLTVPLHPVQGDRFQPTGFPSLGAATYQTKDGPKLLVESTQSMANRLEATCWDTATNKPVAALEGISHVTVQQDEGFLTDSMLEAHRLNSVYIELSRERFFETTLAPAIGVDKAKPVNRKQFVEALLKFDVGSLIHGVFLESLDGRLRLPRALSAFIEASGVSVAASGGVKNDRVKATKEEGRTASEGFGNVPFSRDEYVADRIDCHINFDLAQVRGYGLDKKAQELVILLALYRVRKLLDGDLRLRTACDLEPRDRDNLVANSPAGFKLPDHGDIEDAVVGAITACKGQMVHTSVTFDEKATTRKKEKKAGEAIKDNSDEDAE